MRSLPQSLILTPDDELHRRISALIQPLTRSSRLESVDRIQQVLQTSPYRLLLVDVRTPGLSSCLEELLNSDPARVAILLGEPRTEPVLEGLRMGAYDSIDPDPDRIRLQHLVQRALDHAGLMEEHRLLQSEKRSVEVPLDSRRPSAPTSPLSFFSNAFRGYQEDAHTLLTRIVEGVVRSMMVSRAGIFTWSSTEERFVLEAGLKCLEETRRLSFGPREPLVQWMEIHAHMITPASIDHVRDPSEKSLLEQALRTFGAEIILPLHTLGRMSGWLFIGHRVSGVPFDFSDLENLIVVGEHISTTMENSQLYEKLNHQTTLAATLFQTLPTAIVAAGRDETVHWFNRAAEDILGIEAEQVQDRKLDALGSTLASLFRQCLKGRDPGEPHVWQDPNSQRTLAAEMKPLEENGEPRGAVALIEDRTRERRLQERQNEVERAQFWNELAAGMSHEIRNPLVAIKTFSQLLPERHSEESFRDDFSTIVSSEVDRLNHIVDQINDFANPPTPNFALLDVEQVLRKAMELAASRTETDSNVLVDNLDPSIPMILADRKGLTEGLAHLLANAIEATSEAPDPSVIISARMTRMAEYSDSEDDEDHGESHTKQPSRYGQSPDSGTLFSSRTADAKPRVARGVLICIEDNGKGFEVDEAQDIFSPFYTTKAKGMGLGLAIARRAVLDHGGEFEIQPLRRGTRITLTLPQHAEAPTS